MSNAPSPFLHTREDRLVGWADGKRASRPARDSETPRDETEARHPDHGAVAYCIRNDLI